MNNSSRDLSIDTNLILFWSLPSSQSISTAFKPISTQLLSKNVPWTRRLNNKHTSIGLSGSGQLVTCLFDWHQPDIILKLTVFSVHLHGFYTHLSAITIEKCPLNIVFFYFQTHLYRLFQNWLFIWHQPDIIMKLTVFFVHLNCFYTNLNAIAIQKCPLNMLTLTLFLVYLNGFCIHLNASNFEIENFRHGV